ncbi:SPOR domain-containing protein, partial [Phaeospirillum tilakii]
PRPPAAAPAAAAAPTLTLDIPPGLAADPAAQRFAALRALAEAGAVGADDAETRRNANLGALLPYDQPPPAAGLDQPAPVAEMAARLAQLAGQPGGIGERDLLLDRLLPAAPRQRALPPPRDPAALQRDRDRTGTLSGLGLISPEEAARERAAIAAIEQSQPTRLTPPAAPAAQPAHAKPAHAKPAHAKPAHARPAGDKPARAKAAPVPPAVTAEAAAEAKPAEAPGGAIPAGGKGPVGVHLLSMASPSTTDMAVAALKRDNPELAALTFKAVKTVIPDLGTTYRLLAGPIAPAEAESLCRTLRTRGQSCVVSDFDDH